MLVDDIDLLRIAEQDRRWSRWTLLAVFFFSLNPVIVAGLAGTISSMFGQRLNEANAPDIPVIGELLYAMFVYGWFAMVTIPIGLVFIVIALIVHVMILRRLNRARRNLSTSLMHAPVGESR